MLHRIIRMAGVCAAAALAMGCIDGYDELATDESIDSAEQAVASSTHQFASYYLKNFPTGDNRTQWSDVVINNPNPTPATVTLTVHRNEGTQPPLGVISTTIPARGWYNTYGKPEWLGVQETDTVNHRSIGWVELTSNVPVIATNRLTVRTGATYDSAVSLFNDASFLRSPSTWLSSTYFLRKWPTGLSNVTQWTDITVNNPNSAPASITVRVHKIIPSGGGYGGVHATLNVTVPAKGSWSSFGKPEWLNIPPTDSNGGAIGWIEVLSNTPVVASSRLVMRNGTTYDAPPRLVDDSAFQTSTAFALRAPLFFKGFSAGGTITQRTHPVIVNPNPTPTTITVIVRPPNGARPESTSAFSKTIPAMGWWNAFADPSWTGVTSSVGWTEITSDQPVFGLNRLMFHDTNLPGSPFTQFDDEPLVQTTASQLFATFYLKKWPSTSGYTQWTDLVVTNPSTNPTTITVRIHKVDGSGDLTFFTKEIAGRAMWRSSEDPQWLSLPDSDPANGRSVGWVEITSSSPVIALNRVNLRNGETSTSPIALFEDTVL